MSQWFIHFGTEILGTAMLIIIGNGVVANALLKNTKHNGGGPIFLTLGWAAAVTIAAMFAAAFEGAAHLNPAVTVAFLATGSWESSVGAYSLVAAYIIGQLIGALIGQLIVDLLYIRSIIDTAASNNEESQALVLAIHSTSPTHRSRFFVAAFIAEFIGTFMLIAAILTSVVFTSEQFPIPFTGPLFVGIVLFGVGVSTGGITGYALNPTRDIVPRMLHQLLPFKNKGASDWQYSWVPVIAPLLGGVVAGLAFMPGF